MKNIIKKILKYINIYRALFLGLFMKIENNVEIEKGVIFFGVNFISIKTNTYIGPYSYFAASNLGRINLGKNVSIGPHTSIIAINHNFKDIKIPINKQGFIGKNIVIEDDVWIGASCVVLPGVRIGKGSVIGAGSIVTKNITPYSICFGNPAKIIKSRKNV